VTLVQNAISILISSPSRRVIGQQYRCGINGNINGNAHVSTPPTSNGKFPDRSAGKGPKNN
jgi:hypothetical protein